MININLIKEFILSNFHKKPMILDNMETINKIADEKYSIARICDGEFFLMMEDQGFTFQSIDSSLTKRLFEVLNSDEEKMLVGIPRVFGKKDLDFRTKYSKEWWNTYLLNYRSKWYKNLDFNKVYGSGFFTRNYIAVEDKSKSEAYFKSVKRIWNGRDILLVEGRYSRLGVGNDLFDNAKSTKRILCPNENAFDKYEDILNKVKCQDKDSLILIALGPTATILSYDLYKLGFQAVDIGHIDIEYEWFLQGAQVKSNVKNKYNYEANGIIKDDDFKDEKYESQILSII